MMKITGLSHLFKWEDLHNWWLTKYFFAPLYVCVCIMYAEFIEKLLLNDYAEKVPAEQRWKEYTNILLK